MLTPPNPSPRGVLRTCRDRHGTLTAQLTGSTNDGGMKWPPTKKGRQELEAALKKHTEDEYEQNSDERFLEA